MRAAIQTRNKSDAHPCHVRPPQAAGNFVQYQTRTIATIGAGFVIMSTEIFGRRKVPCPAVLTTPRARGKTETAAASLAEIEAGSGGHTESMMNGEASRPSAFCP